MKMALVEHSEEVGEAEADEDDWMEGSTYFHHRSSYEEEQSNRPDAGLHQ